ncbi:MAG TPA: YceI family protein [Cytophagaceae bacterium]|nr:YceI family protein [Cytophagaceae bacterium]
MKKISLALLFSSILLFSFVSIQTSVYKVDPKKSTLVWTGKKVTGEHKGTIPLSSGTINVEDKKIKSGTFTLDVAALTVTDIADKDGNAKLVGHLKNDDFFSTAKYPTATYVISSVESKGGDNYTVNGNLTIKGITNPVSFPAVIKTDAKTLTATGVITVNRTKYDIKFKSASFFENLGDKAIYDDFTLEVNLTAAI